MSFFIAFVEVWSHGEMGEKNSLQNGIVLVSFRAAFPLLLFIFLPSDFSCTIVNHPWFISKYIYTYAFSAGEAPLEFLPNIWYRYSRHSHKCLHIKFRLSIDLIKSKCILAIDLWSKIKKVQIECASSYQLRRCLTHMEHTKLRFKKQIKKLFSGALAAEIVRTTAQKLRQHCAMLSPKCPGDDDSSLWSARCSVGVVSIISRQ